MNKEDKQAYDMQYRKDNYKSINFAQPIDYMQSLEAYCKARGIKKNTFIKLCIDKEMMLHPIDQYMKDTSQLEEGGKEERTEEQAEEQTEKKDMKTEQKEDTQEQIKEALKDVKREIIQAIIDGLHAIE